MATLSSYRKKGGSRHAPVVLAESVPQNEHHIFVWEGGGRNVFLLGSFNNWTKVPLGTPYGVEGVSVDLQLPVGTHQYIFEVDGVKKKDPASTMPITAEGFNQVIIKSIGDTGMELSPKVNGHKKSNSPKANHQGSTSLFFKYPFQANNSILSHLKLHGYSSNVVQIQWKSPNTSVVVVTPADIGSEIISNLHGTKIDQRYELNVELYKPKYDGRRSEVKKTSITASGHCKLFIGSGLPKYTNEQHIRDHFEKFSRCITNVEVVRDRYTNDCKGYGYVTFMSVENARQAKEKMHRSKLLGVVVNVNFRTSRRQLPLEDREVNEEESVALTDSVVVTVVVKTRPKMPQSLSNTDFRQHFRSFSSDITNAYVIRENEEQHLRKGHGKVEFSSIKAAEYAVEKMTRTRIMGKYEIRHIYIEEDSDSSSDEEAEVPKHYTALSHKLQNAAIKVSSPIEAKSSISSYASSHIAEEPLAQTSSVEIQNLDPLFTESQINSMIEVPMISCQRLPSPSNSVVIKCHTPAEALAVVNKLDKKRHLGKTLKAFLVSDNKQVPTSPDLSEYVGLPIKAVPTRTTQFDDASPLESEKAVQDFCEVTVELEPQQWNMLMLANPATKILQYSEIKEPFINNPDITFSADHDQQCLKLSGKHGAVENAHSFLMKRLKQTIQVENRHKMKALYYLNPNLPSSIRQNFGVLTKEYKPDSSCIKFEGSSANIVKAHSAVIKILRELKSETIQLDHDCSSEDIERHNQELSESAIQVFISQEHNFQSALTIWSFDSCAIEKAKPILALNVFEMDCGQEEVMYLKTFAKIHGLPAKIKFEEDRVVLKGTKEDVEKASVFIHEEILQGLFTRKFSFNCKLKIWNYIEQTLLKPNSSEDQSFRHLLISKGKQRSLNIEAEGDFEVYIYSKNPQKFSKISSDLDCISPTSMDYPFSKHCALKLVMDQKAYLENKHHVMLTPCGVTSFVIDGINPSEVHACHDEIKTLVENNLETSEEIPISCARYKLLKLYEKEIKDIESSCDVKIRREKKEGDNCIITYTGLIRRVNDAQDKLSDLLSMEVYTETFTMQCPYIFFRMWKKRWTQIKQQEERNTKTCVSFHQESHTGSQTRELTIRFEIIGSDTVCVQEAKEAIESEGTKMEEKEVSLSSKAIGSLQKISKEEIFKDVIADIKLIEKKSSKVILVAPKESSECLNTAEDIIRKLVGEKANATYFMSSRDSIIDLILSHTLKGKDIAFQATELTQHFKVGVTVQKQPAGLRLSGSESSLEKAKPLVRAVFENIEATIGTATVSVEYIYGPYLTSAEFWRFETKIGSELCVTFSYPKPGQTSSNTLVYTTHLATQLPGVSVKVEIHKGDLVREPADAIVNAANEDLQHIGGLAKAILDAGGQSIQQESDEYIATHKKVATGTAVCLGPGQLPCKKVIHAVGPRWKGGQYQEEFHLHSCVLKSLEVASTEGLTSIAFPAIGAGVFGVPVLVSARMSIAAVKKFVQSAKPNSIRCIKFVLVESTVTAFVSEFKNEISGDQKQHFTLPISTLDYEAASEPPPPYYPRTVPHHYYSPSPLDPHTDTPSGTADLQPTWEWMNDIGVFEAYSPSQCMELESAFKSNQNSIQMKIYRYDYTIDFVAMEQTNMGTGGTRKIRNRRNLTASSSKLSSTNVQWQYKERRQYLSYTPQQSAAIEKMYQNGVSGKLSINNAVYNIDISNMTQTNSLTKYSRKIRRQVSFTPTSSMTREEMEERNDSDDEVTAVAQNDIIITIRGPRKDLETAEKLLRSNLKGSLSRCCIDKLPNGNTAKLEKALGEIARKNTVKWSFSNSLSSNGQTQRVMQLHGVSNKCKAAVDAINDEILNFYQSSAVGATYPTEWVAQSKTTEIFKVRQGTVEWSHVHGSFIRTMHGHQVIEIDRIQNKWLWEKYDQHKRRLERKNNGQVNEKELFHGTRGNDPSAIYEGEEGFDMRFSANGMWGMANYFAVDASYSDRYSYQCPSRGKQMFLVKVLTGFSFNCPTGDAKLRMPPQKATSLAGGGGGGVQLPQMRYDTVTGQTHGTQVFMTYDNDKAYPAYLITYT